MTPSCSAACGDDSFKVLSYGLEGRKFIYNCVRYKITGIHRPAPEANWYNTTIDDGSYVHGTVAQINGTTDA